MLTFSPNLTFLVLDDAMLDAFAQAAARTCVNDNWSRRTR
jgi:hypothetical protein